MPLNFKRFILFCTMMVSIHIVAQKVEAINKKGSVVTFHNNTVTTALVAPIQPIQNDVWFDTSNSENTRPKIWNGATWVSLDYTGTPGSIFFTGTGNYPTQDNNNFFWDSTNSRLGLGTNTPNAMLDIEGGTVRLSDYGAGTITGTATNILAVEADGDVVEVDLSSFTTSNQTLSTTGSAGNISISAGNSITLNVNDSDADPLNEIQTISKTGNTITLNRSGGSITETKTTISQSLSTGIITHTSEDGTSQAVNLVSANSNNNISVGTDGGAYYNNPIKAYGKLIPVTGTFTATGISGAIKNSTGKYTFTMATTRTSTNYVIQLSVLETGTNEIDIYVTDQTTTTFSIAIIQRSLMTGFVDRTCYFTVLDF